MTERSEESGVDQEGSTARTEAPKYRLVAAYDIEPGGHEAGTGWEYFWGLGYYGRDGRPYLTTWSGDRPIVQMLSINCALHRIPLWDAEVPRGALLVEWPDDPSLLAIYTGIGGGGGHRVIGWRTETRIERRPWDGSRESPVVCPK